MKKLPLINFLLLLSILVYLIVLYIRQGENNFENVIPEITTERLNIVGQDGNKYLVLSSPERQALATIDGKPVDPDATERNIAGLLFFNEDGDEIGGLVYGIDSANSYQLLTFDQRKNDQIMALRKDEYLEKGEWKKQYGLLLQQRSDKQNDAITSELRKIEKIEDSRLREKELEKFYNDPDHSAPYRLFLGRTFSDEFGLYLMDESNNTRLQIYLDKEGVPHIESIDENGEKKVIE
ncbi:MAG: hypothetical protein HWE22_15440 [Flavobacteriales bacterium]|nr:hypothetical protein [Flavobacteriales bacterium]